MPHITLVHPFLPRAQFASAEKELVSACKSSMPFGITLAKLDVKGGVKPWRVAGGGIS
jgi:hypothetical protein